jgi:hypothetical protein
VQGDGITGEIADLEVEDLVRQVAMQSDQTGLLENQLTVDDEREQVPDDEGEVRVSLLFGIWRGSGRPDLAINPNFYFIRADTSAPATFRSAQLVRRSTGFAGVGGRLRGRTSNLMQFHRIVG